MQAHANPILRDTDPLAHSQLAVTITDLIAAYELTHIFRNDSDVSMEAIYSFPVPLNGVFMGMQATLAGEHLLAHIQPRGQATHEYDEAMVEGDSAVMLEQLEPGMLCVNLGNLKPGEEGEVSLRFAAPLHCADGTARFSLPLVHRPRYGRSQLLDELTEPRHDFALEHPLTASIHVRGLLANAPVSCAAHAARFSRDPDGQTLRLGQAMLDRDLVVVFDLPADFSAQARQITDAAGHGSIGTVSFVLPASLAGSAPCDVCLALDCSGSMSGDAIKQSRAALRSVVAALRDDDHLQVLRFGSDVVPLFRRPLKATPRVRNATLELVDTIDSDLGGTEMDMALVQAIQALAALADNANRSRAIVLVTDGAVQPGDLEDAKLLARQHGVAIFVVAVGSSAGADVLAPLAHATGAVLERAVPAEPIDAAVMHQMRRARAGKPVTVTVDWVGTEAQPLPLSPVYPGDAAMAFALLSETRNRGVAVRVAAGSHQQTFALPAAEDAPSLRALAGHAAWQHATADAREAIALRYGLVTNETSAVLVKQRADDDKADALPVVTAVAHMVPAGMLVEPAIAMDMCLDYDCAVDVLDMPAFLRRAGDTPVPPNERRNVHPKVVLANIDRDISSALCDALIRLLLDEQDETVTLANVLGLLDAARREPTAAWLAARYPGGLDRSCAISLLQELLDNESGPVLNDDQEARLAVVIAATAACGDRNVPVWEPGR